MRLSTLMRKLPLPRKKFLPLLFLVTVIGLIIYMSTTEGFQVTGTAANMTRGTNRTGTAANTTAGNTCSRSKCESSNDRMWNNGKCYSLGACPAITTMQRTAGAKSISPDRQFPRMCKTNNAPPTTRCNESATSSAHCSPRTRGAELRTC